jgi:hypothetical protein
MRQMTICEQQVGVVPTFLILYINTELHTYPLPCWHLCTRTLVTAQFFVQLAHADWGQSCACHLLLQYDTAHISERKPVSKNV